MVFLWFMFYCTLCPLFSKTNSEQIHSLPGQPKDFTLKQSSGYIVTNESHGRSFFYYFVEAQSKRSSPALVPLTLWIGGAFGCSSVGQALFTGNGPFRPRKDGRLVRNPYSWNLVSNMLYVDSPIGSGFSFSNTPSDYSDWNLTTIVNENLKFIVKWFERFPEYKNSDFYMGGDGGIGHLVPQVAALLLEYNKNNVNPIKLKGLAAYTLREFDESKCLDEQFQKSNVDEYWVTEIGNMGIGYQKYLSDYLWYHGVISQEMYTKLKTVCSPEKALRDVDRGKPSKECDKIMFEMNEEIGKDVKFESLLSPICVTSNSSLHQHVTSEEDIIVDPCLSDYTTVYLNRPEVQKAFHINKAHLPYSWDECAGGLITPVMPLKDPYTTKYIHTLSTLLMRHIRILLYSGDQDTSYNVVETRKIADTLSKDSKLICFRKNGPWYNGPQVGGWSESYGNLREGKNITYLTFASVKGGSHFVPSSSPSEVFTLFKSFLKGSPP